MRPTSPREIIPTPTRIDSRVSKPHNRANTPQPTALATIATSTSNTVNADLAAERAAIRLEPDADEEHRDEHRIGQRMHAGVNLLDLNSVCPTSTPAR